MNPSAETYFIENTPPMMAEIQYSLTGCYINRVVRLAAASYL